MIMIVIIIDHSQIREFSGINYKTILTSRGDCISDHDILEEIISDHDSHNYGPFANSRVFKYKLQNHIKQ